MKNGIYTVSFDVQLNGMSTQEDAQKAIIALLVESIENSEVVFPEVNFSLIEEHELDYTLEEDELEELNFEESA